MPITDQREQDAHELRRLGYAQELLREMGGFSNFALSFSIISILTGAVTLYGHGLKNGGPLVMSLGWPAVTLFTLAIAASLAQLASAYPTAGALYHWSSRLGGRGLGWLTAWLNTIGQFAITAGIDFGLAEFVGALLGYTERMQLIGIFSVFLVSHALLNHFGVRLVARLNDLSAWYHMLIGAIVVGALYAFAPHQPVGFLAKRFTDVPGQSVGYGFLLGLLQACWTFTGYDASAHVTEETVDPRRNAPWGIFLSVAVSGLFGWVLICGVTVAIDDLPKAAAAQNPFIHVLTTALGGRLGATLVWLVLGAMWFCGLASITSNSRMLYAFARDGGLPFAKTLAKVSPRFQTPHVAVWVSAAMAFVVALWADAYEAITALSTLLLYASYGLPICALLYATSRGRFEPGPWRLGRASRPVAWIAVLWIAFVSVVFVLPPNQQVGIAFAGCLAGLAGYWAVWMRARFKGPPDLDSVKIAPPATASAGRGTPATG